MCTLRGRTHGYHMENCCILQCAPLVAAHVWPHKGNHTLAQHGQYIWQTHLGFMWVPCGYFERQKAWVPCGKLLHTAVCPISGSRCMAHERHTRGSFMVPMEFCYLGCHSYTGYAFCLVSVWLDTSRFHHRFSKLLHCHWGNHTVAHCHRIIHEYW